MSRPEINIDKLKLHLRIELDDDEHDLLLKAYWLASVEAAENHMGRKLYPAGKLPDNDPNALEFTEGIECGCMLFVGHLFANREAVNSDQARIVPFTIKSLWDVYRQPQAF